MSKRTDAQSRLDRVHYGWLKKAARWFLAAAGGPPPESGDLVGAGAEVSLQLAPRYDESRCVTFATFCTPAVFCRWRRMKARCWREVPMGIAAEVLSSLRSEGSVLEDSDAEHAERLSVTTDVLMTALVLSAERMEEQYDGRRMFAAIRQLDDMQRDLLWGLFAEGKTLAELSQELGVKYAQARWQMQLGMCALSRRFRDSHGDAV